MTYKLVINGKLSGLNDYIDACRRNRYVGADLKKREQIHCVWHIMQQLPKEIHTPIRLTFRWGEPDMKRDLDNICFAKKFIIDALVESGRIKNDGWRDVKGFTDEFFIDKKNPRIEVTIEELE